MKAESSNIVQEGSSNSSDDYHCHNLITRRKFSFSKNTFTKTEIGLTSDEGGIEEGIRRLSFIIVQS